MMAISVQFKALALLGLIFLTYFIFPFILVG